ncbi:hypothetical protein Ddye_004412 [Dipteronia dyeriana]|uniref:Uncharacterized protein n=1 Tax=Dipteronia dyeriana TaxID=168575 RepID=A0AAD9XUU1_9ROSI|nr:hypothetical protein Ddye_004412 [Dipteronia dyeriana]
MWVNLRNFLETISEVVVRVLSLATKVIDPVIHFWLCLVRFSFAGLLVVLRNNGSSKLIPKTIIEKEEDFDSLHALVECYACSTTFLSINCLGALDETHVKVRVPILEKPKNQNRKGDISTNVLGVCSQDMQFIYVLLGWEASTVDGRVLRDAICRANGLRVPHGYYYLVYAGYTNYIGFLASFRGQRREMLDDGNDIILEESDDEDNESTTTVEPSDELSDMRLYLAGHIKLDTSKTKGPYQNIRFWTEEEDNKLIESLLELNNDGRIKAKGSFKPGHLKELEKKLHAKLPGCDLLAKPHIES